MRKVNAPLDAGMDVSARRREDEEGWKDSSRSSQARIIREASVSGRYERARHVLVILASSAGAFDPPCIRHWHGSKHLLCWLAGTVDVRMLYTAGA